MTAVADGFGLSRIGQIAMTVGDLPRAVSFYRDVLGMRFLFEAPPAMAFFDCGGVRLMMSLPEEHGEVAGQRFGSIIYYTVPDIQEAAAVLGARGVTFDTPPHVVAPAAARRSVDGVLPGSRSQCPCDHERGPEEAGREL